jgi:hypothetical protein
MIYGRCTATRAVPLIYSVQVPESGTGGFPIHPSVNDTNLIAFATKR